MPAYIIHKDGVYNFYCSIADGAWFESGLTLEQLTEFYQQEFGKSAMVGLPARLERAHERGTSCMLSSSLESSISCNRAGPGETKMTYDDFVAKFLTIAPEAEDEQA